MAGARDERDAIMDAVIRAGAAWKRRDFRSQSVATAVLAKALPSTVIRLFCERSDEVCDRHGVDATGDSIWFLFGCGMQVWLSLAERREQETQQVAAVLSLNSLYLMFAKRLRAPADGTTEVKGRLGTACYMLWDMDGGLGSLQHSRSTKVADSCFSVLETALTLDSPACQLSALHALGHSARDHRSRVEPLIDAYLHRNRSNPLPFLRPYAIQARSGYVQ